MGSKPETLIALEQAIADKVIDANKSEIWDCTDDCFVVKDKTTRSFHISIQGGIFKLTSYQMVCISNLP
jgi:hypothetical protein